MVGQSARRAVLKAFPGAGDVRRLAKGDPPEAVLRETGKLRARVARQAERLDRQAERLDRLAGRLTELEAEAQEARRLNKRVAELTDIVAEVLLPADQRDDDRIRAALSEYVRPL